MRLQVYDAVREEFATRGAYFLNEEEREKVRQKVIVSGWALLGCCPPAGLSVNETGCGRACMPFACRCEPDRCSRVPNGALRTPTTRTHPSSAPPPLPSPPPPSRLLRRLKPAAQSWQCQDPENKELQNKQLLLLLADQRAVERRHCGPVCAAAGRDLWHRGAQVGQGAGGRGERLCLGFGPSKALILGLF